jgi:uncharacterized repeat protein (TIGR03803 family)
MKSLRNAILILGMLVFLAAIATVATAQTYTVLYNFGSHAGDPLDPNNNVLAQGVDGNVYGSSWVGGTSNLGTIYRITPNGIGKVLYNFDGVHGANPSGGLTLGTDGNFYGVTYAGGTNGWGTIFKITPKGELTVLYNFANGTDGVNPYAGLVQWIDGNFYGSTLWGNEASDCPNNIGGGCGAIFKVTPSGELTVLDVLDGKVDGQYMYNVQAPLTPGTDGNFYGSTINGGDVCCGTVFKMTPSGKLTLISDTNIDQGASAYGTMAQGTDGNLYGVTHFYGGDVFEVTSTGQFNVLEELTSSSGMYPYAGLILAPDSNFYGAAMDGGSFGDGTIFQLSQSGNLAAVWNFDGEHGSSPAATLLQHTNGSFYGTANQGGAYNDGVVFAFDMGIAPFVRLLPPWGRVGKTVAILGQGLTGTTSVSFNGTPATFTVEGDTLLTAIVPIGASTGSVTVTTPTGTLTSNLPFHAFQ